MEPINMNPKNLKVAIISESLTQFGGAEVVLTKLLDMFPNSVLFTPLYSEKLIAKHFPRIKIISSFLQKKFFITKLHRFYINCLPIAFESFDFSGYDLVISNTSSFSKGVNVPNNIPFIAYVHSPTRYLWSDFDSYANENIPFFLKPLKKLIISKLLKLREWDIQASKKADLMLGNSQNIVDRILKYYHRKSYILYPFADPNIFIPIKNQIKKDYYFMSGRLVPYKKFDIAIKAFNKMQTKKLIIVGTGNQLKYLNNLITSKNIHLLGRVNIDMLAKYYREAKGYVFTPLEDFGITPIESMMSGTPVIAYGKGGALETVKENISGIFFKHQNPNSLIEAIKQFESMTFDGQKVRSSVVAKFSPTNFENNMLQYIEWVFKLKKEKIYD